MLEGAAQEYWSSTSRRSLSGRLNVNLKKRKKKEKKETWMPNCSTLESLTKEMAEREKNWRRR